MLPLFSLCLSHATETCLAVWELLSEGELLWSRLSKGWECVSIAVLEHGRFVLPVLGYSLLSSQIRELVPESQAYMDLLAFERKLDQTIMRKRVDIQEALKRPMKVCCEKFGDCVRGGK